MENLLLNFQVGWYRGKYFVPAFMHGAFLMSSDIRKVPIKKEEFLCMSTEQKNVMKSV